MLRVSHSDLDEVLAKLTRNVRQDLVLIRELYPKGSTWENCNDLALDFNILVCHK